MTEPWTGGAVAPGLTCVLAPNASPMTLQGTNTWLVETAAGVVVVDPGPDDAAHVDAVVAALAGRPCAGMLLTHGHDDHRGAVLALALATGARLLPAEEAPAELQAHPTPGHTADSVTYVLAAERIALTGDTVLGEGTTVVAWPDGSLAHYLRSLGVLRGLVEAGTVERIAPGHGPMVDALTTLDHYLTHRESRLEAVRLAAQAAVRRDPGLKDALPPRPANVQVGGSEEEVLAEDPERPRDLADDVVDAVYTDVPDSVLRAARLSVLAQLDYLGYVHPSPAG